jgi:sulfite exporter TauE/SafE
MTAELDYYLAFAAGILGSGHCIGMCGALVSSYFMTLGAADNKRACYAAYHGARISVYALAGMLAALLGVALISTGLLGKIQGILQILIGLMVILIGLKIFGLLHWRVLSTGLLPRRLLQHGLRKAHATGAAKGAALAGMVNGFMPCPLVLAMAVKATTAPSAVEGGLMMLAFGAGTLPSMLFVSIAFARLSGVARGHLLKVAAVIVIIMGISTMYRGILFFTAMKGLANW